MSIEVKGINEATAAIRATTSLPREVLDDMATVAFGTMRAGAGRHSPRPMGTGNLFRSLYRAGVGSLVQEVGHDATVAPYAQWVVFGSVPHRIEPKRAKALRWFAWAGGPAVFSKGVNHPGYRGDNYRDEALDDVFAQFSAIVDRNFRGP